MMRESTISSMAKINAQPRRHVDHDAFHSSWSLWYVGAAVGLIGGFLATVVGLILTMMAWLAGPEIAASATGQLGTWLIIATIPAMMFGAHCLDKIEAASKAKRIEYCRQHGLSDEHCAGSWR